MFDLHVEQHLALMSGRTRSQQDKVTRSKLLRVMRDDSTVGRISAEISARAATGNEVRVQPHRSGDCPWMKAIELVAVSEFSSFCGALLLPRQQ